MHRGLAQPDRAACLSWAASLPDVRGSGAGLALIGSRVRVGARAGVRDDGHRLARDEPPLVALLAGARVPPLLPAALPVDPLAQSAPLRFA